MPTITHSTLKATVGKGGRNLHSDVLLVQSKLNKFDLVPLRPLTVDGHMGPLTIAAIENFQSRYVGMSAPDGRVDPGGCTLQALMQVPQGGVAAIPSIAATAPVGSAPHSIHISGKPLSPAGIKVLTEILESAGLTKATVTSVGRNAHEQAVAMYDNCKHHGTALQYKTYGSNGDKVIDVYTNNAKKPRDEVISLMENKIKELGPEKVSHHASQTAIVFDVGHSSLAKPQLFFKTAKSNPKVSKVLNENNCIHIEIPLAKLI